MRASWHLQETANLADAMIFEWGTWDSLAFEVAARLVPATENAPEGSIVDSATVKLWTKDPIPVFDGGEGIVVEHEKDSLAHTNILLGSELVRVLLEEVGKLLNVMILNAAILSTLNNALPCSGSSKSRNAHGSCNSKRSNGCGDFLSKFHFYIPPKLYCIIIQI